ncbi:ABC transporter ATP-binding protein [Shewanella waksmanii]|uniref:ABC transporter ATP-binding protein n=1 Tax=Shewanella waksmanii TaxID=213783 RepID=UPI0037362E13
MSNVILSVDNISLEYKSRAGFFKHFTYRALDGISFDVEKGEVFGVLGRNGSGKSSLLKVLAGTLPPDRGNISYSHQISKSLLSLGLGFNSNLTGRDNALISCMLNGYSRKRAQPLVDEIGAFAELGDFYNQPVKTYSSGMRSRLGFAAALLTKVDLLLIDETLSVGDAAFNEKAEAALRDKMAGSQTVIFVSHSINQINKLCNRCMWLDKGKVITLGSTEDVMAQYLADKQKVVKI